MILPKFGKWLGSIIEGINIIHSKIYGQRWVRNWGKLAAGSISVVSIR